MIITFGHVHIPGYNVMFYKWLSPSPFYWAEGSQELLGLNPSSWKARKLSPLFMLQNTITMPEWEFLIHVTVYLIGSTWDFMALKHKSFCIQILKIDVAVTSFAKDSYSDGSRLLSERSNAGHTHTGSSWEQSWGVSSFSSDIASFDCYTMTVMTWHWEGQSPYQA